MKMMTPFFLLISLLFLSTAYASPVSSNSPVGYWQTIDDVTGKPKSILHIYQSGNVLYGEVTKIFPKPGADQHELCTACAGEKHNQPIVGMVVLEGLKQSTSRASEWNGGKILDPSNGKTYHCYLTVMNKGQKLNVRGYIGVALFGRTQTWVRLTASE
jgi:uncharacterized protein (DUF2147 family)